MKLPLILSAMIAAFAIPASLAEDATEEKTETAAPEAEPAATPEAAKPAEPKAKPMHRKHKMHHHRHGGGGRGHTPDGYDLAFDDPNFPRGSDGSGCGAEPVSQGKVMPPEVPGQAGPMVPAGQ